MVSILKSQAENNTLDARFPDALLLRDVRQ